jgi:hypothetical protein
MASTNLAFNAATPNGYTADLNSKVSKYSFRKEPSPWPANHLNQPD